MFWTRASVCPSKLHRVHSRVLTQNTASRGHRRFSCRSRRHRRTSTTKSSPLLALYQTFEISRADDGAAGQLSIYPEPEREIVVVDSPSVLETQIGVARRAVTGVAHDFHARVHGVVSKWIGIEHAVERVFYPSPHPKRVVFVNV